MAGETVIGALKYDFIADTSGLKSGLSDVTNSIKKVTDKLRDNTREFERQGAAASKAVGFTRNEMLNLTRQLTDTGVSLASGMSPFMVLIQQGGQVADVFQSTKANIGTALGQLLLNTKTVSLGIVAAIGAIATQAYTTQAALEALTETAKALGTNRAALRDFGTQMNILGVDPEKVNEQLVGLAQKLREAQISGGDLAKQLQAIGINLDNFRLPQDFPRLFEEIAQKIRTGSNELDRLNAIKLLGLSDEFRRVFMDGRDAISDFVRASEKAADDSTKPFEDKWRKLRQVWSDVSTFIGNTSSTIVNNIIDFVSSAIGKIGELIDFAKRKYAEIVSIRFPGEQLLSAKGQGESVTDYEKRLGLDKAKSPGAFQLPEIQVGKEKTNLAAFLAKPKNDAAKAGRSSGAGGMGAQSDEISGYLQNLHESAIIAQTEADNWAKGNLAREKAVELVKLELMAKQQGRVLTEQERANAIKDIELKVQSEQKTEDQQAAQDSLNDSMREFANLAASAMDQLIIRGQKATDVLKELLKHLASAALRGMLTGEGMFGKLFGMEGSKEGGVGGLIGKALSFIPKFAQGGTLGAGRWGIAGEAGPELVKGPAHITPLSKMGQQGARVTVHNYGNQKVEARQMSDGEILVVVGNMIQANNRKVPGLVADAQRRSL